MPTQTPGILVVEDEEALRETIADIASTISPHVFTAGTGIEALAQLHTRRVGLIISDINMPHMSGLELLREIRKSGNEVPLIFITAHSHKEYIVEAFRLGATDYIEKPFDVESLLKKIEQAYSLGLAILDVEADLEKLVANENLPSEKLKRLKECRKAIRLMEVENQQNERKKKE